MADRPEPEKYEDAIRHAAARALLELPQGVRWESIVAGIWHSALMWKRDVDAANKEKKSG